MWKGPKELFNYNKKQRNGLLILVALAILLQLFIYFDHLFIPPPKPEDTSKLEAAIAEWELRKLKEKEVKESTKIDYYQFDPNTVSAQSLKELGLKEYLADRVVKYRKKGGRFKRDTDLLNIYGMDTGWYEEVLPYVVIEKQTENTIDGVKKRELNLSAFDINKVSKAELEEMNVASWKSSKYYQLS